MITTGGTNECVSKRSTLVDFLYILRDVFAKEPPVASKQAVIGRLAPPQAHHTPPAIPPLPPQLTRPELPPKPSPPSLQNPPQLPPKPGKTIEAQDRREPPIPEKYKEPLPLPPLRNGFRAPRQQLFQHPSQASQPLNGPDIHLPRGQPSTSNVYTIPNQHQQGPMPPYQRYPQERPDSVSPITQTGPPLPLPPQSLNYGPSQPIQYAQPVPIHPHVASPQSQPTPQYGYYSRPLQPSHPIPVQQEPMRPKQPTPDLLTSPFDLELPSQPQTAAPPPIPPNPEKDFLLQTLSRTLTQTLHDSVDKANFALQPLNSQSQSIHAAIATLKSEISALNSFHATLQSNTSILQQSLQRADSVIADAHARLSSSSTSSSTPTPGPSTTITSTTDQPPPGLPAIDEVLVPPTVVGKQIYDLVADERGIERAMYALQTGLVKGRVGLDTWAKLTRGLAREAFLKKALIRKAGVGMGLNV